MPLIIGVSHFLRNFEQEWRGVMQYSKIWRHRFNTIRENIHLQCIIASYHLDAGSQSP